MTFEAYHNPTSRQLQLSIINNLLAMLNITNIQANHAKQSDIANYIKNAKIILDNRSPIC